MNGNVRLFAAEFTHEYLGWDDGVLMYGDWVIIHRLVQHGEKFCPTPEYPEGRYTAIGLHCEFSIYPDDDGKRYVAPRSWFTERKK